MGSLCLDGVLFPLESFPWPVESETVEEIQARGVFEYVDDLVAVMEECHRILGEDGKLKIVGIAADNPRLWDDVRRKRGFTSRSFDAFDPDTKIGRRSDYVKGRWRKLQVRQARQREGEITFYLEKR